MYGRSLNYGMMEMNIEDCKMRYIHKDIRIKYEMFAQHIYLNNIDKAYASLNNMREYAKHILFTYVTNELFPKICDLDDYKLIDDILTKNYSIRIKFKYLLDMYGFGCYWKDCKLDSFKVLLRHITDRFNSDIRLLSKTNCFNCLSMEIKPIIKFNKNDVSKLFEYLIYNIDNFYIIVNFMKCELLPNYIEDINYCYTITKSKYDEILNKLRIPNSENYEYSLHEIMKFDNEKFNHPFGYLMNPTNFAKTKKILNPQRCRLTGTGWNTTNEVLHLAISNKCKILRPKIIILYTLFTLSTSHSNTDSNIDNNVNLFGLPIELIFYITQILIDLYCTIIPL